MGSIDRPNAAEGRNERDLDAHLEQMILQSRKVLRAAVNGQLDLATTRHGVQNPYDGSDYEKYPTKQLLEELQDLVETAVVLRGLLQVKPSRTEDMNMGAKSTPDDNAAELLRISALLMKEIQLRFISPSQSQH